MEHIVEFNPQINCLIPSLKLFINPVKKIKKIIINFKIKFETSFHIYLILDAEFINFMNKCIAMNFKIKSVLTNLKLLERPVKCLSKRLLSLV